MKGNVRFLSTSLAFLAVLVKAVRADSDGIVSLLDQGISTAAPSECLQVRCCEDDCCGPGTSSSYGSGTCLPDLGSPGFVPGMWSDEHEFGCIERVCCENECCEGRNDTVYEPSIGRCLVVDETCDNLKLEDGDPYHSTSTPSRKLMAQQSDIRDYGPLSWDDFKVR